MMMLGAAVAWALGSDAATTLYAKAKLTTQNFSSWMKLPVAMVFAGFVLAAALLVSSANPVLAVAAMGVVGIIIAPLTSIPSRNIWIKVLLFALALALFLLADVGILSIVKGGQQDGERFGAVSVLGLFSLLVGIWWLSKGWGLITKGIAAELAPPPDSGSGRSERCLGKYLSLFVGLVVLILWVGLLVWSSSSDWAYDPSAANTHDGKPNNNLNLFVFIVILGCWPYSAWKRILERQSNAYPDNLKWHRGVTVVAGMFSISILSLAVIFGIQNGQDRLVVDQLKKGGAELQGIGAKIGDLKRQDLKTTDDYIRVYGEIEQLEPEFDEKIDQLSTAIGEARRRDETRGLINIQRLYRNAALGDWQRELRMIEVLRQISEVTKQESLTVRNMAALPQSDQPGYWATNFKPFGTREESLRLELSALYPGKGLQKVFAE